MRLVFDVLFRNRGLWSVRTYMARVEYIGEIVLSFRKLPLDLSVTVRARTLVIGPSNLLTWAREQHIPLDFGKTVLHL